MSEPTITVRVDDLEAAISAAGSNPYLFDDEGGTEWLTRLQAAVEAAKRAAGPE